MVAFRKRYQENTALLTFCKYIADICMVIVVAYTLVLFLCSRTTVIGSSMEPAVYNDDTVMVNKIAYAFAGPQRYDVIAFKPDSVTSDRVYIKRVMGLPGETIQIINGKVYINDKQLDTDVVDIDILTSGIAATPVQLGEDEYFVLGDNRNNSEDSRFANIGLVKKKNIIGNVWLVYKPFKHFGFIK